MGGGTFPQRQPPSYQTSEHMGAGPGFGHALCRAWSPVLVRMVSLPPLLGSQAAKDIPALQQEKDSMGAKGTEPKASICKGVPIVHVVWNSHGSLGKKCWLQPAQLCLQSPVILPGSRNGSRLLLLSLRFLWSPWISLCEAVCVATLLSALFVALEAMSSYPMAPIFGP